MTDGFIAFGSGTYFVLLGVMVFTRGMDFLSTWVATPGMVLEGNPLARKLGWRGGVWVNAALCLGFALWPFAAVVISTTSAMVAARNFQSAWLMRSMGEEGYRLWYVARLREVRLPLYLGCFAGQVLLTAAVGSSLMIWGLQLESPQDLFPFAVGLGVVTYSLAVAVYTLLSVWRIRR